MGTGVKKSSKLSLATKAEWRNWPLWLKGLYIFWPSLGPAYLFLKDIPMIDQTREISPVLANIEYHSYLLAYFVGLWAVNLVILGIAWMIIYILSPFLSSKKKSAKTKKKVSQTSQKTSRKKSDSQSKRLKKKKAKNNDTKKSKEGRVLRKKKEG